MIQADKRENIPAIKQERDRIDKKIMDEVKQLERNLRDENQR
jgi:predicted DNA-binding transcriptional regulator